MTSIDDYKLVHLLFFEMLLRKPLPTFKMYGFSVLTTNYVPIMVVISVHTRRFVIKQSRDKTFSEKKNKKTPFTSNSALFQLVQAFTFSCNSQLSRRTGYKTKKRACLASATGATLCGKSHMTSKLAKSGFFSCCYKAQSAASAGIPKSFNLHGSL